MQVLQQQTNENVTYHSLRLLLILLEFPARFESAQVNECVVGVKVVDVSVFGSILVILW